MTEKTCPLRAIAAGKDVPCSCSKCAWWFEPFNYRANHMEPGRCALLELAQSAWESN